MFLYPADLFLLGSCFVKFLLCFSLIKNTKTLFDTAVPPGAITCINGIRTLSITWVIQGHVLVFGLTNIGKHGIVRIRDSMLRFKL